MLNTAEHGVLLLANIEIVKISGNFRLDSPEPLSLIFRVFTAKISGIPKFRNFTVSHQLMVLKNL